MVVSYFAWHVEFYFIFVNEVCRKMERKMIADAKADRKFEDQGLLRMSNYPEFLTQHNYRQSMKTPHSPLEALKTPERFTLPFKSV